MVASINIGVIAAQGAISEHLSTTQRALQKLGLNGRVFTVKNQKDLEKSDALILPGGESTTIFRLLQNEKLIHKICTRIEQNDLPLMGTCAGCILLSTRLTHPTDKIQPLKAMNMEVERNAFGRQKESFEKNINIKGLDQPFKAVFIRAPIIRETWSQCTPIAWITAQKNKVIVGAQQKKLLALSFHPELTDDLRIHKYFLEMI